MAQKSKPRTPRKSTYRGFEGVDLKKTHSGDESIAFIENFCITDDGSLKKRYGYKEIYRDQNDTTDVTASYSLNENGVEVCYFALERYVKKYNSATQTVTDIGALGKNYSNVFFFEYLNSLYVCDGHKIFTVNSNSLSDTSFYIPLYVTNWNAFAGEKKEAPNLLWPKVAITYKLTPPSTSYLSLGDINLQSIDALYRNGELLSSDKYYVNEKYNAITVPEFNDNDEFLAILTFIPDEQYIQQQESLLSSKYTSSFYELNKNNLFFWGNDRDNRIFYSTNVDKASSSITFIYPNNNLFYVPLDSFFTVSSERDRINAFIRHYDRVLIMTDSATWITNLQDIETNSLKIKNINSSIGCAIKNGCVRIENTIFSIGKDAIYAWSADTDELNECNAHSISEPIRELLGESFFKNCLIHLNYGKREIWFFNPSAKQTLIYSYIRKVWYGYSGFSPSAFLNGGSEVRFFEEKGLFVFDSSLECDILEGKEQEITARVKSGELEFNSKSKKKLSSATVRGIFSGGALKLRALLDGNILLTYDISPSNAHSVISFRTKSGSFSSMTFELVTEGKGEQIIHGIELIAD